MPTDPLSLSFDETVEEMGRLVRHLERLVILASEDDDPFDSMANRLIDLNVAKGRLADAYKAYELLVAHEMERNPTAEYGGVTMERKQGAPRKKWAHKKLGREVARRIIDSSIDMDTGEILMSQEQMLQAMLQYAAPSYWRVTELKKLGISADDYCELGEPKVSVVIRKPKG